MWHVGKKANVLGKRTWNVNKKSERAGSLGAIFQPISAKRTGKVHQRSRISPPPDLYGRVAPWINERSKSGKFDAEGWRGECIWRSDPEWITPYSARFGTTRNFTEVWVLKYTNGQFSQHFDGLKVNAAKLTVPIYYFYCEQEMDKLQNAENVYKKNWSCTKFLKIALARYVEWYHYLILSVFFYFTYLARYEPGFIYRA